ncbi:cyclin-dependent kinase inhibitor 3 family protein [Stenotrophomonas sp. SAU14A_NAIMI4_8]|uniref:cyclin-dependent kinase inhibitor 3 family protein n=1 Tax=Stenotrophomonas sp. SAU14A_NAIMI4_8 TaxID=2072409 RepID=UPI000D53DDC5|nr:cyclin-dependent kinase inhibitor 3 family protein [Stenotrophomonas sp. SAU14A_NAIMI4_8]AWH33941.1 protein tyrosine phosphatase [Stenotrophomonas sp. SAU14A_NAIMI4_8]
MIKTSQSHPLQIAELPIGNNGGAVGITFAPGKQQANARTGSWNRDIDTDLATICSWGASHLVSLIEPWEFEELQISELPNRATLFGLQWHGLPIADGAAPDAGFLLAWSTLGPSLSKALLGGKKVVIHCKGGLGRAGTVACMLLIDSGAITTQNDVIREVRRVRPGALETLEQENFVLNWGTKF